MPPPLSLLARALSDAYRDTLDHVRPNPKWTMGSLRTEHARSLMWVARLASHLTGLWAGDLDVRTRCKPIEQFAPAANEGELLTDVHVVRTANVDSVQTRAPIRIPVESLLAAESEFEGNSRDWLEDLAKLFLVRAPCLLFVSTRAGNDRDAALAAAQLEMYAAAARHGLPRTSTLLVARIPHPREWATTDGAMDLHRFDFDADAFVEVPLSEPTIPARVAS